VNFRAMMIFGTVAALPFAIAFVFVARLVLGVFGIETNGGGILISHVFGALLLLVGLLYFFARDTKDPAVRRAIALSSLVGDAVGLVFVVWAMVDGVANSLGWAIVALYLVLVVGWGYCAFAKRTG
jgi:hypothetical protein